MPHHRLVRHLGSDLPAVEDGRFKLDRGQRLVQKIANRSFVMPGLTFLYKLIPNMVVSWSAAIWGGLVAGILWQLNHLLSAMYVSHILMKNDLYAKTYGGSLGLLPVFMLAVYFTWLIILYGALVAARVQYHSSPLQETVEDKDAEPVKPNEAKAR